MMIKNIVLKIHGFYETLDVDGNVNVRHLTGELPYIYDSENLINETLLSGDLTKLSSPRQQERPTSSDMRFSYLTDSQLCSWVFKCDERYVYSFTLIETEPILNMMKFVFLDRRKHITNSWVFI